MQKAIEDLKKADLLIKSKHKYWCGLEDEGIKSNLPNGKNQTRYFFNSPDGQNIELYYALREMKWRGTYRAPYLWKVEREGIIISYTEGDVYVKEK